MLNSSVMGVVMTDMAAYLSEDEEVRKSMKQYDDDGFI